MKCNLVIICFSNEELRGRIKTLLSDKRDSDVTKGQSIEGLMIAVLQ